MQIASPIFWVLLIKIIVLHFSVKSILMRYAEIFPYFKRGQGLKFMKTCLRDNS